MAVLSVLVGVLGVAAIWQFVLMFAVVRRLRLDAPNTRRAETIGRPPVGFELPSLNATTLSGVVLNDEWYDDETPSIIGIFAQDCAACDRVVEDLKHRGIQERFLAFVREPVEYQVPNETLVRDLARFGDVAMFAPDEGLLQRFKSSGFPTLVRVEKRRVVASGFQLRDVQERLGEGRFARILHRRPRGLADGVGA